MLILSQGRYFFGWAKPVPINPYAFKDQRLGMLLTGIAGPVTNIGLAALAGVLIRIIVATAGLGVFQVDGTVAYVLQYFAYANLVLAFFNLIPIPPLDGSRVVQFFLPDRLRDGYHSLERYGFILLIGLTWVVPGAFGTYIQATVEPLFVLFTGL